MNTYDILKNMMNAIRKKKGLPPVNGGQRKKKFFKKRKRNIQNRAFAPN